MPAATVKDYKIVTLPIKEIPPGDYEGVWGGYVVHATINGVDYEFKTDKGIRTPAALCVVHVKAGEAITVDPIE